MKIEIMNQKEKAFKNILLGDIFATSNNELYVKCSFMSGRNAVAIRDGAHIYLLDSTPVRRVKAITVEFE